MPDSSGKPIAGDLPHGKRLPDGTWELNPDGTRKYYTWDDKPLSGAQEQSNVNQAEGGARTPGTDSTSVTGVTDITGGLDGMAALNDAPGSSLFTGNADDARARERALVEQLQQQAITGGGAWEKALAQNTAKAEGNASALGQSNASVDYASQLRNIGNAQGAAAQTAVGQGNVLREQSKQDAQNQLGDILGQEGSLDINQADAAAKARAQVRAAKASLEESNTKTNIDVVKGTGEMAASFMSDGGSVPGKPRVFGDDEKNDTVPAMLSPGEIVIPRSVAEHPNAPEAAAAFIRSLKMSQGHADPGVQHLAEGGTAEPDYYGTDYVDHSTDGADLGPLGVAKEKASLDNGALLQTGPYEQNRADVMGNAQNYADRAAGTGASPIAQQTQNANDAALIQSLQQQGAQRGQGDAAAAGNAVQTGSAASQAVAGQGASAVAKETSSGQDALGKALLNQRSRDLAMAQAQQQAAWRNTQLNTGISLANQATIRNIIGGTGQAATAFASGLKHEKGSQTYDPASNPYGPGGGAPAYSDSSSSGSSPDDWEGYSGGDEQGSGIQSGDGAAHGGIVEDDEKERARSFLASLKGSR